MGDALMARKFGKIDTGIWQNPKFRLLSDDAQKMFLYLCTCKHTSGASAYELSLGYITDDLNWPLERVDETLDELALKPFVLRDPATNIIFIPGWWDHNQPENPKVAIYLSRQLLSLPDCPLKRMAIQGLIDSGYRQETVLEVLGQWDYRPKQDTLPLMLGDTPQRLLPAPGAVTKPKIKSTGTRLSPDWVPTEEDRAYARKKGWGDAQIEAEAVKFVRYWTGPDAKAPIKKDWHRTWCNRIDDMDERRGGRQNGSNGANGHGLGVVDTPWVGRLMDFKERGFWAASWGPKPGQQGCQVPPSLLAPV